MSLRETRKFSESSGTDEEPDFLSEDYHKVSRPTSSTTSIEMAKGHRSLTKNASLWGDVAMEQNLNESISNAVLVKENERGFERGSESYIMPADAEFDDRRGHEVDRRQKMGTGETDDDDNIFNPASNSGQISEFGVKGTFRVLKKKAKSGRFQHNHNPRRDGNEKSNDFNFNNRKRKFMGSKESLSSNQRQERDQHAKRWKETPKELVNADFSIQKFLATIVPKHLVGDELGQFFAEAMGEQNPAVQLAGEEICLAIFNETKRIEEKGGMLVANRNRRRTPGGVFLTLFRQNTSISQQAKMELQEFSLSLTKIKDQAKLDQKIERETSSAIEEMNVLPTAKDVFLGQQP